MTTMQEIKERLIEIFVNEGYKRKDITEDPKNEEILHFSIKKINYQIYIEDKDSITYGIESIDDTDYSQDFLQYRDDSGDIDYFEDYLNNIEDSGHQDLRKVWLDLEKMEEKYSDVSHDFIEIIKHKFDLY